MSEKKPNEFYEVVAIEERRLLDFFRNELKFGEVTVIVKRGVPVFVKQAIKEIKLDS